MTVSPELVGKQYPPGEAYVVGREKIRDFVEAVGHKDPRCKDVDVARAAGFKDVIAPPTFAVLIAQKASSRVVLDPTSGIDFSRVVHGEQELHHTRPIVAGDEISTTTIVDKVRLVQGNAMITLRDELRDAGGELVTTAISMLVVRAEGDDA